MALFEALAEHALTSRGGATLGDVRTASSLLRQCGELHAVLREGCVKPPSTGVSAAAATAATAKRRAADDTDADDKRADAADDFEDGAQKASSRRRVRRCGACCHDLSELDRSLQARATAAALAGATMTFGRRGVRAVLQLCRGQG